jgi:hypothetical protein
LLFKKTIIPAEVGIVGKSGAGVNGSLPNENKNFTNNMHQTGYNSGGGRGSKQKKQLAPLKEELLQTKQGGF